MNTTSESMILGIDLGTSSVKLSLLDSHGKEMASASESYPIYGREWGYFEQDPDEWLEAIKNAFTSMDEELCNISAIGLSAQMPTLVVADRRTGKHVSNAILWCDARAELDAEELLLIWGKERHYSNTGIILDGRYIIPMAKWLMEADSTVRKLAESGNLLILSAKDYLILRMTGNAITDPSTASGFGVYAPWSGKWSVMLCEEAEIEISQLPQIMGSSEAVGELTEEFQTYLEGKTKEAARHDGFHNMVINGGADSVCGLLGSGISEVGDVCQIWGSSTAILAMTDRPELHPNRKYFITPTLEENIFAYEADILAAGTSVKWLSGILADGDIDEMIRFAEESTEGSKGLSFYPYIAGGEQSVLWDYSLRGGIRGMTEEDGREDIARALLEGLCYEVRRALEEFSGSGFAPRRIVCSGHLVSNKFFARLLADILGRDIVVTEDTNSSALGAAILAGRSIGLWTEMPNGIAASMQGRTQIYSPDADTHQDYGEYYYTYIKNTCYMRES